jgi:glycosyltransferase involved in cell wall biosynthesis
VVHFHGLWQFAHARLSRECVKRGLPCVVSPHGMLEPWAWKHKGWKKRPYFRLVERSHLSRVSALLATSEDEAAQLRRFFPRQKVEVIPLGLTGNARPDYGNVRAALDWREDWVLLYLSRIHPKKGLDLLLEALVGLEGRVPAETRLVIVGDGDPDYLRKLRDYCSTNEARLPRIDWVGPVWGEERWKYFQGADLFCLPSHSENFGLAVLDACQVGTPVLTTNTTPWGACLGDGRGFIASPTAASVREGLERFFSTGKRDDAERGALADWAWGEFHWDSLGRRYMEFYETLR